MRINACSTTHAFPIDYNVRDAVTAATAELQSVPSYRGKPHHAIAHRCIITAKLYSRRENLLLSTPLSSFPLRRDT